MIHILGYDKIPQFKAFDSVKNYLENYIVTDVYLGAFCVGPLGIELKNKIIYNMEYLHDDSPLWAIGYKDVLEKNTVLDFSRQNVEYLAELGILATYMPYGISKKMQSVVHKVDKDIDVLFIGSTHFDRRIKVLDALAKHCNLVIATDTYGTALDELISRAKVHLNMHHAEGQPLETVRLNYLIANNCTVVSEQGNDALLNSQYNESLIFSTYADIVDKCLFALRNYTSTKRVYINENLLRNPILDLGKDLICQLSQPQRS